MNPSLNKSSYRSWLRASICCVLFCFFYQTTAVHAFEKTNHSTPIMLIGGFGLQFAGALVGTSAQNNYDQYLYSVGSKMAFHREKQPPMQEKEETFSES